MSFVRTPKLFLLAFMFFGLFSSVIASAADEDGIDDFGAEMKARQAHEKASSDMIFQNEEWKALYYQNQRIIQLLKEISASLDIIKARGGMKTDEKTA